MIAIRNLGKSYGPHVVLGGVSLEVHSGEVAVIVGPSGGGKSTLLRCLNGLETFQQGSVRLGETELTPDLSDAERKLRLAILRRRAGMVFQQFNLFPHRSVLGNIIEAPICVRRQSRDEATAIARKLLDRVGLADKADAMPDQLSGGQQQRVAIARALAMQPEVLLFDEPTSALDPQMAAEVESVIADLAQSGQTMLVVTHAMRLARKTAHTLHVCVAGRIIESGPPQQVFENPQQTATGDFLRGSEG